MTTTSYWSRLKRFFSLAPEKRRKEIMALNLGIEQNDFDALDRGLSLSRADLMSENIIGSFSLPFSIGANFIIDDRPCLIPMVTEEPSIVAGVSKMAKIIGKSGGITTKTSKSLIKGQIQLYGFNDIDKIITTFKAHHNEMLHVLHELTANMKKRGGGVRRLDIRPIASKDYGPMVIIEPILDVVDAMGANVVNTISEKFAKKISEIFDAKIGIKILSNLCDERLFHAQAVIDVDNLSSDTTNGFEVAKRMVLAQAFAEADIYRACTHNKGILNGIDAVAIATGNDFRAIEASAHAFASMNGQYKPLTNIKFDETQKKLHAALTIPLAVGVVGGLARVHDGVIFAKKILGPFAKTSQGLSSVMASVGLTQCLAALLALSSEGIQKGHMKLHQKKQKVKHTNHDNQ